MHKYVSAGLKVLGGSAAAGALWFGLGESGLDVMNKHYLARILPDAAFATGVGTAYVGLQRERARVEGRVYGFLEGVKDFALSALAGATAYEMWECVGLIPSMHEALRDKVIGDLAKETFKGQGSVLDAVGATALATATKGVIRTAGPFKNFVDSFVGIDDRPVSEREMREMEAMVQFDSEHPPF
ncbi:MAG: hypothetical protein ABIG30_03820 [Candidatus Aenigmatarchaeota archaeon]